MEEGCCTKPVRAGATVTGEPLAGPWEWRVLGETLGVTDPDAPPPPRCLALAFAEAWMDDAPTGSHPVRAVAVGISAPQELIAALGAEPGPPDRVETQWSVEALGPGQGGLVCCRVTALGANCHRLDLLIPAMDWLVTMFVGASTLIVSTDEDLATDAQAALQLSMLLVPNDIEFWRGLTDVEFGEPPLHE